MDHYSFYGGAQAHGKQLEDQDPSGFPRMDRVVVATGLVVCSNLVACTEAGEQGDGGLESTSR